MKIQLSSKQRKLLHEIAESEKRMVDGEPVPLHLPHWSDYQSFLYDTQAVAYVERLKQRGLITIRHWIRS
jgi:hypothetical protein